MQIQYVKLSSGIRPDHKIETVGMHKKAKVRPLNPELSKQAKEVLLDWKKQGIIRESKGCHYGHVIVVVGKKGGGIRICVDFRTLNVFTVRDASLILSSHCHSTH